MVTKVKKKKDFGNAQIGTCKLKRTWEKVQSLWQQFWIHLNMVKLNLTLLNLILPNLK